MFDLNDLKLRENTNYPSLILQRKHSLLFIRTFKHSNQWVREFGRKFETFGRRGRESDRSSGECVSG